MPKLIDETGRRYGRLLVLSREDGKWLCKCDCGNDVLAWGHNLRGGRNVSCGCLSLEYRRSGDARRIDETGHRFGSLVVQRRAGVSGKSTAWLCKCDCGREVVVRGQRLRRGSVTHCGCLYEPVPRKTGTKHHNWKGESVGYHALHIWVNRNKVKTGVCSLCGANRYTEWGMMTENFSRNLDDYIEVCKPCHMRMDKHPWVGRKEGSR